MRKISYTVIVIFLLAFIGCEETTSPNKKLEAPLNFTSNQLGFESIELSWEDNEEQNSGFRIDRRINEGDWVSQYKILVDSVSTFIDSNLVEIGNYSYRIYSTRGDDKSDFIEASLAFSYDDVISISVSGDGETVLHPLESRTLQFILLDAVSDPVERNYQIYFTLLQAPEGVSINNTILGDLDTLTVTSDAGMVNINLTAGSEEGIVTLKAWVNNSVGAEINTLVELELDYQYPEVTNISSLNDEDIIMNSSEIRELFFILKDEFGNPVQDDYEVWFKLLSAPNGTTVNDELNNPNDSLSVWSSNGIATILLEAGNTEGEVTLEAYTFNDDSAEISCQIFATIDNQYLDVAEIVLIDDAPITLVELFPVEIRISLRDEFGGYVQEESEVFFQFIERPYGTHIDYLYEIEDSLAVMTVNGFASITLFGGPENGNVGIKIFTFNSKGEEIAITKTDIYAINNVPSNIGLEVGGINEGEDLGNGQWRINLTAYAHDSYGYPILDGLSFYWSLYEGPEGVFLEHEVTQVGNGDNPEAGTTFNSLTYDGTLTNEVVEIRVGLGGIGGLSIGRDIILPVQFPVMDIVMIPIEPDWDWDLFLETISPRIVIRDGQNNLINNQTLIFESALGTPIDMDSDEDDDPYTEVTGYNEELESNGMLIKDWQFNINECPPPEGDEPGAISDELKISVPGTDLEQIFPITLYRYPVQSTAILKNKIDE